jgi:hypothetical protein
MCASMSYIFLSNLLYLTHGKVYWQEGTHLISMAAVTVYILIPGGKLHVTTKWGAQDGGVSCEISNQQIWYPSACYPNVGQTQLPSAVFEEIEQMSVIAIGGAALPKRLEDELTRIKILNAYVVYPPTRSYPCSVWLVADMLLPREEELLSRLRSRGVTSIYPRLCEQSRSQL